MSTENIDDLFRSELDGHATPPSDALWARLQAQADTPPAAPDVTREAAATRLDGQFRQGLRAHATPPRRELWERLEDEYLRPRKRRAAAWWPMALAAAVALLLVAGGAGLWLGFPLKTMTGGAVATRPVTLPATGPAKTAAGAAPASKTMRAASPAVATGAASKSNHNLKSPFIYGTQKNTDVQATRLGTLASSNPKAKTVGNQPAPVYQRKATRQLDAATERLSLIAQAATHPTTARPRPAAADEPQPRQEAPAVAVVPKAALTPETPVVPELPAAVLASAGEIITVDVRSGAAPIARPAKAVVTAQAATSAVEPRRLGSRLLQQAGHLVRGERLSLAEVTGLPETVTVRATVAGRSLTKSIQL